MFSVPDSLFHLLSRFGELGHIVEAILIGGQPNIERLAKEAAGIEAVPGGLQLQPDGLLELAQAAKRDAGRLHLLRLTRPGLQALELSAGFLQVLNPTRGEQ